MFANMTKEKVFLSTVFFLACCQKKIEQYPTKMFNEKCIRDSNSVTDWRFSFQPNMLIAKIAYSISCEKKNKKKIIKVNWVNK